MGDQPRKTGIKSPSEATKKIKNPAPTVQAVLEAEPLALFADPMTLRRAMANPGGLPPRAIPGLQRAIGNQHVQLMLTRADPVAGMAAQIQKQAIEGYVQQRAAPGDAAQLEVAQRQADPDGGAELSDPVTDEINRGTRRGGSQLPKTIQARMKRNLGIANPEEIQVHTDQQADTLSKTLGARAFTTGSHIFFRQGEYDPGSSKGQALLYHESVHTVQQGGVKGNAPQTKMVVNPPDDRYEQQAEAVAEQAVLAPEPARPQFVEPSAKPKTTPHVSQKDDEESDEGYQPQAEALAEPTMRVPENTGLQFAGVNLQILEPSSRLVVPTPYVQMAGEKLGKEEKEEKEQEAKEKGKEETREESKEEKEERKKEAKEEGKEKEQESKEESKEKEESSKEEAKATGEKEGQPKEKKAPPKVPKGEKFTPPPPKVDPSVVDEIDGDTAAEVKFDPDAFEFEEPEQEPLLPTWDELAAGTVQLSMEEVQEEYRIRLGLADSDPADFQDIDPTSGAITVGPGPSPPPAKGRGELIGDAFAEGMLTGFTEGAKSWATDTALELATSKIKYADGMINLAKMAYDPKAWVQDNVFAVGQSFADVGQGFVDLASETFPFGVIAGTLELAIKIIDAIQSVIGLIQQILQILIWIFHVVGKLAWFLLWVFPTPLGFPIYILVGVIFPLLFLSAVCPTIISVCDSAIAFLDPINQILSNVGNVLNAIKFQLQPWAILFRTLDLLACKADPDELEKKQQKLQANIQGYTQAVTTKTLEKAKTKAGKAISKRRDKRKIEKLEAEVGEDPDLQAQLAAKKDEFKEKYDESVDDIRAKAKGKSKKRLFGEAALGALKGAGKAVGEAAGESVGIKRGESGKLEFGGVSKAFVKRGKLVEPEMTAEGLTREEAVKGRGELKRGLLLKPKKLGKKIAALPGKLRAAPSKIAAKARGMAVRLKMLGSKEGRAMLKEELKRTELGKQFMKRRREVLEEQAKTHRRRLEKYAEAEGRERLGGIREKLLEVSRERVRKYEDLPPTEEQEKHMRNREAALEDAERKGQQAEDAKEAAGNAKREAEKARGNAADAKKAEETQKKEIAQLNKEIADIEKKASDLRTQAAEEKQRAKQELEAEADSKDKEARKRSEEAAKKEREAQGAETLAQVERNRVEVKQRDLNEAEAEVVRRTQEVDAQRAEVECLKTAGAGEEEIGAAKQKLKEAEWDAAVTKGKRDAQQRQLDEANKKRKEVEYLERRRKYDSEKTKQEANRLQQEAAQKKLEAQQVETRKSDKEIRADELDEEVKAKKIRLEAAQAQADSAEAIRQQNKEKAKELERLAREKEEEAKLYEEAAKESELIARKELYRVKPPEDITDEKLPWYWKAWDKWSNWTKAGALGGQRHGFGITGTNVFGYILSKVLEYFEEYKHAREKTDEAIRVKNAGQYQEALDTIYELQDEGLGADTWQERADKLREAQYGAALSYFEKKKKIEDYEQLAYDMRSSYGVYDPRNPPASMGQRLKLQLNTLTPGLPPNAETVDKDTIAFVIQMRGQVTGEEGLGFETLLEDEITVKDFPQGQDKFEKDYYHFLGAGFAGPTIGLTVRPKPVEFKANGVERTYTPKYFKVDKYDEEYLTRYDVWIGYESTLQFTSTPVTTATIDEQYRYDITTDRGDEGDTPSISYSGTLPPGLTWSANQDGTATLQGAPTVAGNYEIELRATDNAGFIATQSFTVTVSERLAFTSVPVETVTKGEDCHYDITVQDLDAQPGDQLVITDETKLTWLKLTDNGDGTATLEGAADDLQIGEHSILLKAERRRDGNPVLQSLQPFTLTVRPQLGFAGAPQTYATVGQAYSYSITPTGDTSLGSLNIITVDIPPWSSLGTDLSGNKVLEGTPQITDVGPQEVELQVMQIVNSVIFTATQSFTLTVRARPQFTSTEVTTVYKNKKYEYNISTTDPDTVGSRLAITAPTQPDWLNLTDNGDGTAALKGEPKDEHVGPHYVVLKVEGDYGYTDTQDFTVTVLPLPQPKRVGEGGAGTAAQGKMEVVQRQPDLAVLAGQDIEATEAEYTPVAGEDAEATEADQQEEEALEVFSAQQPPVVQRQPADEAEGEEEEEEGFISDSDIAYQKQLKARTTVLDVAPEPPPNMIERVQGAALAYEAADAEEYDLALQQQQIGGLAEHGQGQMVELEGARKMTALNKQGVDAQIQDAETQMQTQDQMQTNLASQEGQAKETAKQGSEGQNVMAKIFGEIMKVFGMGSSQGAGDNGAQSQSGEMKSGMKDTAKTTGATAEATKSGQQSVDKNKARTMKVKEGAESAGGELDALDDKLANDMAENQEGMEELGDVAMTNEEDLATVREEKSRLRDEHLQAVAEAELWAEEHRFIREEIFFQLESEL
jgi:hypothetical protein